MRFLVILSASLFCSGSILFLNSLRREPPERSVHGDDVDLGPVEQGRTVPFVFRVTNGTAEAVTVVEVAKSCGCTILQDRRGARIGPGETLTIDATLDTTGRRGPAEVASMLSYRGVEEKPKQLVLAVRADVRPTLELTPASLAFPLVDAAIDRSAREVSITSRRLASFLVLECEPSAPWLKARVVEPASRRDGDDAGPARVEVSVDAEALAAEGREWFKPEQTIRIRTTSKAEPALVLPVRVQVP